MAYLLVTTRHLEDRLLFRDIQDFIVGMNYVAVQAFKCGVFVLAFVLMSNHLHFVLLCSREKAEAFIDGLKTAYSRYYWNKYGSHEHLRRLKVDYKVLEGDEALEWAIAYVHMNPVAANICVSPFDYLWGTGNCFFRTSRGGGNDARDGIGRKKGVSLGAMSARQRLRILHSRADLPGEWMVDEYGVVMPESYVRKDRVEAAYRTPRRMQFFLQNSSKAKQRMGGAEDANVPAFRDQVILAALPDICQSLFRKRSMSELTEEQIVELLRQLRFRFSAGPNQLARVTGLSYDEAAKYLDRA